MTKFLSLTFLIFLLPILSEPTFARSTTDAPLAEIIQKIEKAHELIRDLKANFIQETHFAGFETVVQSEGKLFFKKPGRLRWKYEKPNQDEVIVNSKRIWIYTPDLQQVIIQPFTSFSDSQIPLRFLVEIDHLDQDFKVHWTKDSSLKSKDKLFALTLFPKNPEATMDKIFLEVNPHTFLIQTIKMIEKNGNQSFITFDRIKTNSGLKDKLFAFKPPKGIEVIDMTAQ